MVTLQRGVVQMAGADLRTSINYTCRILKCGMSARYSYQSAIDRTPDSYSFGQQIPFISKHTVVLGADMSCKGWSANINWIWRGGRFDSDGRMPDYNTLDLTAGKISSCRKILCSVSSSSPATSRTAAMNLLEGTLCQDGPFTEKSISNSRLC